MSELTYQKYGVDVKDSALAALGAISVLWGEIEAVLEVQIWVLADLGKDWEVSPEVEIVTNGIAALTKVSIIKALLEQTQLGTSGYKAEFRSFLNLVDSIRKERNALMHSESWYSDKSCSPMRAYATSRRRAEKIGLQFKEIPFDRETYEELISRMAKCRADGWGLVANSDQLIAERIA